MGDFLTFKTFKLYSKNLSKELKLLTHRRGGGEFLDLGVGPRGNHNYEFSFSETYKGLKRKKDIKIQYIFTTWLFLARPRA